MKTTQHFEEMIGAWTNLQRQFWENPFMDMWMPLKPSKNPVFEEMKNQCHTPLAISRTACDDMLQAQQKLLKNTMKIGDEPIIEEDVIDAYFDSIHEMMEIGFEAEDAFLDHGFECLEQINTATPFSSPLATMPQIDPVNVWNNNLKSMMQAWQDVAQKALDAQEKPGRQKPQSSPVRQRKQRNEEARQSQTGKDAMAEQQAA